MVFSPLCYAVRTLQYIFQIKKTILPMKKQMPSKVAYFTAFQKPAQCLFHLLVQKYFDHVQNVLTLFNIF